MRTRFCLVLCACLFVGCGPSGPAMLPVSGVVTLDGDPVEGAGVMFSPSQGGRPAMGTTNAAGEFELTTIEPGDGALVGEHKVTIVKSITTGVEPDRDGLSGEVQRGGIKTEWIIPERYSKPDESGLTTQVGSELSQPVRFDLSS